MKMELNNQQLVKHLAETFEMEESEAISIIDEISKHVLYSLVLNGQSDSPIGKLVFNEGGVSVVGQNQRLIDLLKSESSFENVKKQITRIVSGN
jgi:hypothetical protein